MKSELNEWAEWKSPQMTIHRALIHYCMMWHRSSLAKQLKIFWFSQHFVIARYARCKTSTESLKIVIVELSFVAQLSRSFCRDQECFAVGLRM